MKILMTVVASVFLAGCLTPSTKIIHLRNAFDAEEARAALARGNNTVKGSALIRQRGGGVVTCAGRGVKLIPATAYAYERIAHIYGNTLKGVVWFDRPQNFEFANLEPNYLRLTHKTLCDAQGFFAFNDIADGDFFVTTEITWSISSGQYSSQTQGGGLMMQVNVRDGETKEIVLAP